MASERIRVAIADDHKIVRDGLRLIFEACDDFVVVGEAEHGEAAIRVALEVQPDVMLMDLRMPGITGIEAIRRIRREAPGVEIVILTTFDEPQLMLDGVRAGARGYLLKDTDRVPLFNSVRAAARGETLLLPAVAERVFGRGDARDGVRRGPPSDGVADRLTARELEILECVARDGRTRAIAAQCGISERTVKAHLASIYAKLGVDSRTGAVAKAIRDGLLGKG
jgi:NarL family two-component system response regulator YdfI